MQHRQQLLRLGLTTIPVSLVGAMCWFGVFTFVNAYLVKGLGHSNAEWTAATLWLIGGILAWQFICTEISAKLGRRGAVTLGMGVSALAFLGFALTANLLAIHLLLALIGMMTAMTSVAWLPMVATIGGERPGLALAVAQWVAALVGAVALIAGGQIIAGGNYRLTFITFAIACAVGAAIFWLLSKPFAQQAGDAVISLRRISGADLRKLATGPFLLVVLLGFFMEPFNYHTANQLFPNLARDVHGLGDASISTIVALGRLPALFTLALLARHIDQLKAPRVYGLAMLLVALWVVTMGQAGSTILLVVAYFGYYLCHGLVWGSNAAAGNAAVEPRLRDSAFALMSIITYVAIFVTGFVHNRLISAGFTLPHVFLVSGLLAAAAGGALFLYSFSRHSEASPTI
ncbi:MAG: MFS transporter [Armatimonadota bacterium]